MLRPLTRWRNRRAVRATLADPEFQTQVNEAYAALAADLVELEAAGAGPEFGELFAAVPDPATDGVEHPDG